LLVNYPPLDPVDVTIASRLAEEARRLGIRYEPDIFEKTRKRPCLRNMQLKDGAPNPLLQDNDDDDDDDDGVAFELTNTAV
jgi:hypothetical protein